MLEIGSKTLTIEGTTVFADHADPNQFWYLPSAVQLARRPQDDRAEFTLIKYGDIKNESVVGRGFLMFKVNLQLDPTQERRIRSRLSSIAPDQPKLAVVPFDEGTVQCIALDLQGSGGTVAEVTNNGSFHAVESILGATVPSLHGDNSAAFSLTLSKEGAIILESVFENKGTPVGVVYSLKYTGLQPALDVEITANFKRIYDHFSASLEAQYMIFKVGIEAGFQKLVQDGVIQIKVISYSNAQDLADKEKWALDFFKEKLLNEWFTPSLTPSTAVSTTTTTTPGSSPTPTNSTNPGSPNNPSGSPTTTGTTTTTGPTTSGGSPTPTGATTPTVPNSPGGSPTPTGTTTPTVPATPGGSPTPTGTTAPTVPATPGGSPTPTGTTTPTVPTTPSGSPTPTGTTPTGPNSPGGNPTPAVTTTPGGTTTVMNAPNSSPASGIQPNAANVAMISFKLKYIKQIEEKTVTLRYNRTEAVQRTYAPQGFFGLLTQDLEKENHFFEVDGDNAFFREFRVSIENPFDKERINLVSAHVQLDYGDISKGTQKHKDFVIDKNSAGKLEWLVKTIPGQLKYRYQVQYHFDPNAPWQGEQLSYELPAITTEDRTLMIHPFDRLAFLEIEVSPSLIDWSVVSDVEAHLSYKSPKGWTRKEVYHFTQNVREAKMWKLRLSDPDARAYTYHFVYRLKDGNQRKIGPETTEATKIAIPNPFFTIHIEFIPLFSPGDVRMLYLDVEYKDTENNYTYTERLRLDGNSVDPKLMKLYIVDTVKRTYQYRITTIGKDGSIKRGQSIKTEETIIGINI